MNLPDPQPQPDPAQSDAAPAPDPALMRASDADRDRVADRLREAVAEGRITPEEHAERIDAVYAAKTYADLAPLVADLPGTDEHRPGVDLRKEPPLPDPTREGAHIVAVFSGAERKGRWLVEPSTTITAFFGGVDLDFRRAVLSQREVTVSITCVFGGVDVKVPPGVRVVNAGSAVFGGWDMPDDADLPADAPQIRLTGLCLFGGVSVQYRDQRGRKALADSPPGHDHHRDMREALREAHREHRVHRREQREARREAQREQREARREEHRLRREVRRERRGD